MNNDDFYHHFKNLVSKKDETDENEIASNTSAAYEELDRDISIAEIKMAVGKLKLNKSCSEDYILNEVFIKCSDILLPILHKLFNDIFHSGFFPEEWTKACIVPVFKKGDVNDANNYRGISLVSCFGKLFTSILNNRIIDWENEFSILTYAQFGFRAGFSTVDAMFVLQSLIMKTLGNKKRLYCCFIDFQKAFDSIDRTQLWCKIFNTGIQGKLLNIIKSMYNNVKSCVKYDGAFSDYFCNDTGLMQGETLSPILFSLYVNDFEMCFIKDNCTSIDIQLINLFLLMYADDMVILSETPEGLQKMLDSLSNYTKKWKLKVNVQKLKLLFLGMGEKLEEMKRGLMIMLV